MANATPRVSASEELAAVLRASAHLVRTVPLMEQAAGALRVAGEALHGIKPVAHDVSKRRALLSRAFRHLTAGAAVCRSLASALDAGAAELAPFADADGRPMAQA